MSAHLRVIAPGLATSVQDTGRFGYQRFGVPTAGVLDRVAMAAANTIVGNAPDVAVLEMLYLGATFEVAAESVRVACVGLGASLEVTEGGETRQVASGESVRLGRDARMRVMLGRNAMSGVLAIEGGLALAAVMGSRSTFARAGIGGVEGRVLAAGDLLPLARDDAETRDDEMRLPNLDLAVPPRVRIVLGPQDDYFTPAAIQTFLSEPYEVTRAADRMGLRLAGTPLVHSKGYNIVSDGIATGSIQVPGDGQPIILLADRQTTGGYPKIATVTSVDLPALGRVGPGAKLMFEAVSVEVAEDLRRAQAAREAQWPEQLERAARVTGIRDASLYDANLISGVADAWMGD